jgi:hypothetical protein
MPNFVLIVDDEPLILDLAADLLRELGCHVITSMSWTEEPTGRRVGAGSCTRCGRLTRYEPARLTCDRNPSTLPSSCDAATG